MALWLLTNLLFQNWFQHHRRSKRGESGSRYFKPIFHSHAFLLHLHCRQRSIGPRPLHPRRPRSYATLKTKIPLFLKIMMKIIKNSLESFILLPLVTMFVKKVLEKLLQRTIRKRRCSVKNIKWMCLLQEVIKSITLEKWTKSRCPCLEIKAYTYSIINITP